MVRISNPQNRKNPNYQANQETISERSNQLNKIEKIEEWKKTTTNQIPDINTKSLVDMVNAEKW